MCPSLHDRVRRSGFSSPGARARDAVVAPYRRSGRGDRVAPPVLESLTGCRLASPTPLVFRSVLGPTSGPARVPYRPVRRLGRGAHAAALLAHRAALLWSG